MAERRSGDPDFMLSLARGLAVLRAFGEAHGPLGVSEAARRAAISRAAARRCLETLARLGYAERQGRVYHLRPKALELGYAFLASEPLPRVLQPVLEQVRDRLGESCSAGVLEGDDVVYIARAPARRVLSVSLSVGSRLPAWCTSMGRVLLAGLPPAERRTRLLAMRRRPFTTRTVTDAEALLGVLERVAAQGFALVDQELEPGLRSIAVPVLNPAGRVLAAINVGVHAERWTPTAMQREILPLLRRVAELAAPAFRGLG